MSPLAALQRDVWQALAAPFAPAEAPLHGLIRGAGGISPAAGLELYRQMVMGRMGDLLAGDFEQLAQLLGPAGFARLARAYLQAVPPTSASLARLGRDLPAYLAGRPDLAGGRADAVALARLEWARALCFLSGEAAALPFTALAELAPQATAGARLVAAPNLALLALDHEICSLWRTLRAGGPPPPPVAEAVAVAVWRRGATVYHMALEPQAAAALAAALDGAPLAAVCAEFAAADDPVGAARGALAAWFAAGWVQEVETA